jgi:hypothetical protein
MAEVVSASSPRSHFTRVAAACRVLAVVVAVLSLSGQGVASRVAAANATAAIAASSAKWRSTLTVQRASDRTVDVGWPGFDGDGFAPASLPAAPSWELGAAALARVLEWAPLSTETPADRPVVAQLARGPPADPS